MATLVLRRHKWLFVLEKKDPQLPYGGRCLSDVYLVSVGKLKCKAYAMLSQATEQNQILQSFQGQRVVRHMLKALPSSACALVHPEIGS